MPREGLHGLAYFLTFDPADEIQGAIEVAQKARSLDDVIAEDAPETLEAEVQDAPVYATAQGARYRIDAADLPENYETGGHAMPDDPDAEVTYSFSGMEQAAEVAFGKEQETQMLANALQLPQFRINGEETYSSEGEAEQQRAYKLCLGYARRFLLYAFKSASF